MGCCPTEQGAPCKEFPLSHTHTPRATGPRGLEAGSLGQSRQEAHPTGRRPSGLASEKKPALLHLPTGLAGYSFARESDPPSLLLEARHQMPQHPANPSARGDSANQRNQEAQIPRLAPRSARGNVADKGMAAGALSPANIFWVQGGAKCLQPPGNGARVSLNTG